MLRPKRPRMSRKHKLLSPDDDDYDDVRWACFAAPAAMTQDGHEVFFGVENDEWMDG